MLYQLARPIDIGIGITQSLIAIGEFAESLVRERVLGNQFQQVGSLTIVSTFVIAVGEFHLDGAGDDSTLLCITLQSLDDLVLPLLRQSFKLVEGKLKLFYSLLLTSGFGDGIRLLVMIQRLEGIELLHAAIASLQQYL